MAQNDGKLWYEEKQDYKTMTSEFYKIEFYWDAIERSKKEGITVEYNNSQRFLNFNQIQEIELRGYAHIINGEGYTVRGYIKTKTGIEDVDFIIDVLYFSFLVDDELTGDRTSMKVYPIFSKESEWSTGKTKWWLTHIIMPE